MTKEHTSQPQQSAPGVGGVSTPSPPLPDLNSGKYPFELVQQLVDQAAWINMFAMPDALHSPVAMYAPGNTNGVIGMRGSEVLPRFDIDMQLPSLEAGVRAANVVGQPAGSLELRWMIIPYDFQARPDREPPATLLDWSHTQRFAIQEGTFTFGDGQDGFCSFGTGRTFPEMVGGQPQLVVAAIGNITEGFGKFTGHEGTYILSGHITPTYGFLGDIMVRVYDPDGSLRTETALPPLAPEPNPDAGTTYLMIRSQKSGPSQHSTFNLAPNGQVRGVNVPQELRHVRVGFTSQGSAGWQSEIKIGPVIGEEIGFVATNPRAPDRRTGDNPSRFQGVGDYTLFDSERRPVAGFTAQFLEGRTFDMRLVSAPDQPALRFGFFGPLLSGSGYFDGVTGLLLGSTGVGISPHVFSNLYILRLNDPEGKFRAAVNGARS